MQALEIIEILRPAEQGRSKPYLCRGEDDRHYYVKARQTDRRSLWCEWTCNHLGRAFGLPIPPFQLVNISAELLSVTPAEWRNIGIGPAFGSQQIDSPLWFEPMLVPRVPNRLRRDVLVFDWWIRNLDRTDGNPNLLWSPTDNMPAVIDFNLAFDRDFALRDFTTHHLFRRDVLEVFSDLAERAEYLTRLERALAVWDEACNNAPPEWAWENDEHDLPADFDRDGMRASLMDLLNPRNPECWRIE